MNKKEQEEIIRASIAEAKESVRSKLNPVMEEVEELEEDYDSGAAKDKEKNDKYVKRREKHGLKSDSWKDKSKNLNKKAVTGMSEEIEELDDERDDELEEGTSAADSLKPHGAPGEPISKIQMIHQMIGAASAASHEDLTHWFHQTMAQFGPGKTYGVGDNSASNQSSIDMKSGAGPKTSYPMPKLSVKEDLDRVFDSEDLSEEFKAIASTIFEAAIETKFMVESVKLEEEYASYIEEQINTYKQEMAERLDTYLDYVVENWMSDNSVAIESTLRNELMEDFINGLKGLFAEHYIDAPEERIDVINTMAEKVAELESTLDALISENVDLKNTLVESKRDDLVENYTTGMTLTDKEKFVSLAEGLEFDGDLDKYGMKLEMIRENYFLNETPVQESNINEEVFEGEIEPTNVRRSMDPAINKYVAAISRSVKPVKL
jgi:hypothetical protein